MAKDLNRFTLNTVYWGQLTLLGNIVDSSLTLLLVPSQRWHCGSSGNKTVNLFV